MRGGLPTLEIARTSGDSAPSRETSAPRCTSKSAEETGHPSRQTVESGVRVVQFIKRGTNRSEREDGVASQRRLGTAAEDLCSVLRRLLSMGSIDFYTT